MKISEEEVAIRQLLASSPAPETILALTPSVTMQNRISALLAKNKLESLTTAEEQELDHFLALEHLVRLAKADAYQMLHPSPPDK